MVVGLQVSVCHRQETIADHKGILAKNIQLVDNAEIPFLAHSWPCKSKSLGECEGNKFSNAALEGRRVTLNNFSFGRSLAIRHRKLRSSTPAIPRAPTGIFR